MSCANNKSKSRKYEKWFLGTLLLRGKLPSGDDAGKYCTHDLSIKFRVSDEGEKNFGDMLRKRGLRAERERFMC